MMELPTDPYMLLSVVNTKLRDEYSDLDAMCEDFGIDRSGLEERLKAAGFEYKPRLNQFR